MPPASWPHRPRSQIPGAVGVAVQVHEDRRRVARRVVGVGSVEPDECRQSRQRRRRRSSKRILGRCSWRPTACCVSAVRALRGPRRARPPGAPSSGAVSRPLGPGSPSVFEVVARCRRWCSARRCRPRRRRRRQTRCCSVRDAAIRHYGAGLRPQFVERNTCSRPVHIQPGVTGSVSAGAMNPTASSPQGATFRSVCEM